MNASQFNRNIKIYKPINTADGYGGQNVAWQLDRTCMAKVEAVNVSFTFYNQVKRKCINDYPSFYTQVPFFLNWIRNNLK